MKRIYVCLLIFLCFAFVQAQKIKHPALLYTPERIQQVKQRIVNDLKMAEAWASIKKTADEQLQKKNLSKADYLAFIIKSGILHYQYHKREHMNNIY